ncbi:hypothetical protein [Vibrio phage vB_VpM-pA2SJ1]|uniref:Uncharacterized protein n=1 Tax=Vibrio phage vB_VpM-pA2SJ1 TaxID=3095964 RepID=A0AAX4J5K5_9CAUD
MPKSESSITEARNRSGHNHHINQQQGIAMNFKVIAEAQLKVAEQGISVHSAMNSDFGGFGSVTVFADGMPKFRMFDYRQPHQMELLAHHGFMPVHSHYQPVRAPKNV